MAESTGEGRMSAPSTPDERSSGGQASDPTPGDQIATPAAKHPRATVRMYRHGLGDCHLVTLHGHDGATYRILIDCGVILGTAGATTKMTEVMDDILLQTDSSVDLLVATHEHWDHVSGFIQAKDSFAKLKANEVWLGWTENPEDAQARRLGGERSQALQSLRQAAARMQLSGGDEANAIISVLEFFGATTGTSTKDALDRVRDKSDKVRYCDPQDAPVELPDFGARIYVLGPPRDEKLLKKILPSPAHPETYTLAMGAFQNSVFPALEDDDLGAPFGTMHAIPKTVAQEMPFFKRRYWATESWRRIDVAWMADATQFALALDSMTNNTSLVLAIELDDRDVLLFAGDAQVGNWMSWQDLKWAVGQREVTGPDLLKRTIVYKVGHHGSHNATLRDKGLELMDGLDVALIPVDQNMASKKRWGKIPLESLISALNAKSKGFVLRSDQPAPTAASARVNEQELYFEIQF
jgi:beta-lactamase superfamily II metal-dependent hydrolase